MERRDREEERKDRVLVLAELRYLNKIENQVRLMHVRVIFHSSPVKLRPECL